VHESKCLVNMYNRIVQRAIWTTVTDA